MKKKMMFFVFFLIISILNIVSDADMNKQNNHLCYNEVEYIEVYWIEWNILTRTALTIENVRNNYWTKMIIRNQSKIEQFIEFLNLESLGFTTEHNIEDTRLAIDLFKKNGLPPKAWTFN